MRSCLRLFLALAAACSLRAEEAWTGVSDVKFRGYSTLHNFDGTVKQVPLKAKVATGENGRVVSATSDVTVAKMDTGDDKRDRNMMTMFNEAKFRLIKVEVRGAEEPNLKPVGGKPGTMRVALTIAGTRGEVAAAVTNVAESSARVVFDLAFPVSLKAFKLSPPAALGGLVTVKDKVDVTAHVELKKEAQP